MKRFLPWVFYRTLKVAHHLLWLDANRGLELWAKVFMLALGFKVHCYPRTHRKEWRIADRAVRCPPDCRKDELKDEEGQSDGKTPEDQ